VLDHDELTSLATGNEWQCISEAGQRSENDAVVALLPAQRPQKSLDLYN
jgi:hypothetical protein